MNHPARGSYEQSLVEAAAARRERLMNGGKPKLTIVPKLAPVIEVQHSPKSCFRPHSNKRREIMAIVAYKHRVSVKTIRGDGRYKAMVAARQEAMWMMHEYCRMSLSQIGAFFGRDHTTVIHSLKKFSTEAVNKGENAKITGNPERPRSKSVMFSTGKTVVAGEHSLGREPRLHNPEPVLAHGPVSMPNVRSARQ